jgi:hypothetical protein
MPAAAVTVDQAKLVMNAFAATFQNNLVSADVVTWKKFDGEMNDRNGLTVVEQVGPRYAVTRTTNAVANLTTGVQETVFGSEQFKVQDVFGVSMGWADFIKIRDLGDARESEAIKNAAMQLSEQIDAYVLGVMATASSNATGTAGNNVATFDDVANGYTRLKEEGVDDADLRFVGTFSDKQALGDWIVDNNDSALSGAEGVYRQGFAGTVAGIPTMFTQQLPTLTAGTRPASGANVNVNGANQNVNYASVAISGAPGQYLSQTINLRVSAAGTETLADGDTFTIAGVFAYDNRLQASLGRLQQFRVIGNYTAVAGAVANVRIFPAIIVPGTGADTFIQQVNTANATCTAVPANGALITFTTAPSAQHKPRFIGQKAAVIVNTADLIMPATGIGMRKSLTRLPLSVRMWQNSTFATGLHEVRFDVALTANVRDRRRVTRVNGA